MAEINRENKDRLFRFIFGNPANKAWTLSLYNAINGSDYDNPDDIVITTIEDILYMGMKNDISILIGETLNFFEQQSTFSPNLPIRFLIYAGMVYSKYIDNPENRINIYSTKQQMLPIPKLICFYNGIAEKEDRMGLELASAFPEGADPDISVKVTMLNINYGRNRDLLEACQPLNEYAFLIDRIRYHQKQGRSLEAAVDQAITELPENAIIKGFLLDNKSEVKSMCITEYDEVRTMELFKEEYLEEGLEKGREEGLEEGLEKGLEKGREEGAMLMLVALVKDKLLDVTTAAKRMDMSVGEFESTAAKLLSD